MVLTADRAWPGHGRWLRGTSLGCRGWFCWAGPNQQCYCYCCHCCWCCCSDSGWVEPLGVMAWRWVAGIGGQHSTVVPVGYLYCAWLSIETPWPWIGPRVVFKYFTKMRSAAVAYSSIQCSFTDDRYYMAVAQSWLQSSMQPGDKRERKQFLKALKSCRWEFVASSRGLSSYHGGWPSSHPAPHLFYC